MRPRRTWARPEAGDLRGLGRLHDSRLRHRGGAKDGSRQKEVAEHVQKTAGKLGRGPMVTGRPEPATGKTELVTLPPHFDPAASKPLWQPLFDQLLARMRKRSWRTS